MSLRTHKPILPGVYVELPAGWQWSMIRVIHCMPDDQVDGWKVVLTCNNNPVIEVIHREQELARSIALDAAAEVWPGQFKRGAK